MPERADPANSAARRHDPGRARHVDGRGRRLHAVVALVAAALMLLLGARPAEAQGLSLVRSFSGPVDYVVSGATLRSNSNTGNACSVNTSASATVSGIPANGTVEAAYLYYAASGNTADAAITFAGANVTADKTWTLSYNNNGTLIPFYAGREDVTTRVTGNGTYTFSGLSISTAATWCNVQAVLGGFALYVIYRVPQAAGVQSKKIELHDGFRAVRNGTETVAITNFLGSGTPEARFTPLVWEGDPDLTGDATNPEALRFNGVNQTDALNPANNVFNGTINSLNRSNVYGLDLDTFNPTIAAGATTATVDIQMGPDLALVQALMISVAVAKSYSVQVTPDGVASPVRRLPGTTKVGEVFTVNNTSTVDENFDLVARRTGSPLFMTIDSITGPGITTRTRADSARVYLTAQTTYNYTVWYSVAAGTTADNVEYLRARSVSQPAAVLDDGYVQVRRARPNLALTKSVAPSTSTAPGTQLTYTLNFGNIGEYDARGIVLVDSLPTQVQFKPGSIMAALPTGITYAAAYSSTNTSTWTYTPVSAGCGAPAGYDACVKYIRWTLTGDMAPGTATTATVSFVARIR